MNIKLLSFFIIFILMISSCNYKNTNSIYISDIEVLHLNELPSASGISINNNNIYIVGDDSPWLYLLNDNLDIISKIKVSKVDSLVNGRTPKKLKADFEAAEIIVTNNNPELIVISSGSMITTRDTAHIIDLLKQKKSYSKNLRPLYEKIKAQAGLPNTNEINIEAIAFSNDNAYLLHRGNVSENLIIEINLNTFIEYLKLNKPVPNFNVYYFNLPDYKGVSSGFSGACVNPDNTGIIFTASMEDTKDEINDGKVLGSYIGVILFSDMLEGKFTATLVQKNNEPLEKKLEGISVHNIDDNGTMQVITVCDNDDGTSDIIALSISSEINQQSLSY